MCIESLTVRLICVLLMSHLTGRENLVSRQAIRTQISERVGERQNSQPTFSFAVNTKRRLFYFR